MDCSNFREYKFFTVEQWANENLNIHFILFRLITKFYFVKKRGRGSIWISLDIFTRNNLFIIHSNIKKNLSSIFNWARLYLDVSLMMKLMRIRAIYLIQSFLKRNIKRRCYLFPRFKPGIKLARLKERNWRAGADEGGVVIFSKIFRGQSGGKKFRR